MIVIATDGSLRHDPFRPGYSFISSTGQFQGVYPTLDKEFSDNSLLEAYAVNLAAKRTNTSQDVLILCDNDAVVRKANEAITTYNHQDLFPDLIRLSRRVKVEVRWVRGHAGNPANEAADYLAKFSADKGVNFDQDSIPADLKSDKVLNAFYFLEHYPDLPVPTKIPYINERVTDQSHYLLLSASQHPKKRMFSVVALDSAGNFWARRRLAAPNLAWALALTLSGYIQAYPDRPLDVIGVPGHVRKSFQIVLESNLIDFDTSTIRVFGESNSVVSKMFKVASSVRLSTQFFYNGNVFQVKTIDPVIASAQFMVGS